MKKLNCLIIIMLLLCSLPLAASAAPILKLNSRGQDVTILQEKLIALGYSLPQANGYFDKKTQKAVRQFQKKNHLKTNGIVDYPVWEALNASRSSKTGTTTDSYASPQASSIIAAAKRQLGRPYKFGGVTPAGFDCSGFVQYVFAQNHITLPRTADIQYTKGRRIDRRQLRPGDLVFFTTYEPGASHVGIYIGRNNFIHASSSKGVRIDSLSNTYWKPRCIGARRFL